MRIAMGLVICTLAWRCGFAVADAALPEWEAVDVAPGETTFVAVAVSPAAPTRVLAATPRTLYESLDGGKRWQQKFRVPGEAGISAIAIDPSQASTVLIATDRGLYGSFDGATQWSVPFRGAGENEARCTTVAFHPAQPGMALLGTSNGLFLSSDHGFHWTKVRTPLTAREVMRLAFNPNDADRLYVLTLDGLFAGSLASGQWQRRFNALHPQESQELPEEPESSDPAQQSGEGETQHPMDVPQVSDVALDPGTSPPTLYLAESTGLLLSTDDGATWQRLSLAGLTSSMISRILLQHHSPLAIYAATNRGIARYEPGHERWTTMTRGILAPRVRDLSAAPQQLWAATDRGLYLLPMPSPEIFEETQPPPAQELLGNFSHEPAIHDVRDAAIRYAEVRPGKISAWRTQARLRALVPKFSTTADTNLTDFRHWDSGANPDSLLRGERDVDWSASMSWELGDLIWSDDQTSIDVRSKLMVQLRNDLVDEVTRTYFERRRLQIVLLTDPPTDQQKLLEKELRLQELTALIDGLTGGYFSAHMGLKQHR